jgi:hypothetical protein
VITIISALLNPASLVAPLLACGYQPELLRGDFNLGDGKRVPLVGFALPPADARSACVAILSETISPLTAVEECRSLGAPLVFVCFQGTLQWWKQGAASAEYLESVPANNIEQFFQNHREQFSPERVYRAKTWGRFQTEYQLNFVDVGLMPLVEKQVGRFLETLIERSVSSLKQLLHWVDVDDKRGHWLLQTVFWLVSGKILRDKQVASFASLDLDNIEDVFHRVGRHYGRKPPSVGPKKKLDALCETANIIKQSSSLILTTTEALAYVYENALISKKTRSELETHSTPSFLVDYIVGNLADWIREIPVNERSVYEPACGHAAFLVSAMRLLTELLPEELRSASKRGPYLRDRLHGTDIDSFALELARLSLTLTDIPNPDGWDLKPEDMFLENRLGTQAMNNTILLANPPFDDFTSDERQKYQRQKYDVHFINKSAEMLWQTLTKLPNAGVFGVVLPQTFLHSKNARTIREVLLRDYELKEICLFPDGVFSFSDAESVVIVGRRLKNARVGQVRYRRVRERDLPSFRAEYATSITEQIPQSQFRNYEAYSLRLPDLREVWQALSKNPTLADVAFVAKGLDYRGQLPRGKIKYSEQRFPGSQSGFVRFDSGLQLHKLPKRFWMNLNASTISSPRSGTTIGTPQVLLNYAPASRGAWRLKALIDRKGHAITSRFIAVRPTESTYSPETLWALLNSPVANAYAFCHLSKRDNTVGDIRKIPLPKENSFVNVELAVRRYLESASSGVEPSMLQQFMLEVDREVLKLYSMPVEMEQSVLGLFLGYPRVGVPFKQAEYLPKELAHRISFAEFIEFEQDWTTTNRERCKLIDKSISGTLSSQERSRLEALEAYAEYHIDKVAPRPTNELDRLEQRLFGEAPNKARRV